MRHTVRHPRECVNSDLYTLNSMRLIQTSRFVNISRCVVNISLRNLRNLLRLLFLDPGIMTVKIILPYYLADLLIKR